MCIIDVRYERSREYPWMLVMNLQNEYLLSMKDSLPDVHVHIHKSQLADFGEFSKSSTFRD